MKKMLALSLMALFSSMLAAQVNLVPNPSFEDTIPHNGVCYGPIEWAVNWFNPNAATTDYYTYISTSANCMISSLNNPSGYQLPRTGNSYLGIFTAPGGTREYAAILLDSILSSGCEYYIEFYVSRADKFGYANDKIGCAFTNDTNGYSLTAGALPLTPAIESPTGILITDSLNWVKISGIYFASGFERYLLIGNFHDDANTYFAIVDSTAPYQHAYYYIDDVKVLSCDCTIALGQWNVKSNPISLFPNPATTWAKIENINCENISSVEIYRETGILIRKPKIKRMNNAILFEIADLNSGNYMIEIILKNEMKILKELTIIH